MESLLALKGIKVVTTFNTKGDQFKYAYSEKMRSIDMFIEYYEHLYQPTQEEKPDEIQRTETGVGIILYHKKVAYHFMMLNEVKPQLYTTQQAVPKMQIYRLILDLVEIIQTNVTSKLIELLDQAAIDTFTSLEFSDEPVTQKGFHDMIFKKIRTIQEGIEAGRLRDN